jgi:predicted small secreted protein
MIKLDPNDIEINDDYQIVYKGVILPITRELMTDYQFQTGMDANECILFTYNNSLSVIRDKKLNDLLDE